VGNIWQSLERTFIGGAVFAVACAGFVAVLYLLYRLIGLTRPKEVRWEEKRILSHRMYRVSGRGRIAYLTLCLEETLRFYGQDLRDWEGILRRMWSITDNEGNDWIFRWQNSVGELLPDMVLRKGAEETASAEVKKARMLYERAGTAMIVIYTIMDNASTIVSQWDPETAKYDPDALYIIEKVEETMDVFGVPLPSDESIQLLLKKKDFSLGEPFDGMSLSYLNK